VKAGHLENNVRTFQNPDMETPRTTTTLVVTPNGMALLAKYAKVGKL
jgi:hypothetical protein